MYTKSIISAIVLIEWAWFEKQNVFLNRCLKHKPLNIKYKRNDDVIYIAINKDFSNISIEKDYPIGYDCYNTWISTYKNLLENIK